MKKIGEFVHEKNARVLAKIGLEFCRLAANSRCVCIYHQPKMPEGVIKFKKTNGKNSKKTDSLHL